MLNARITGITMDGGYEEYVVAPEVAAAPLPEGLADTDAAPLMCAGVTTFNALRHIGARPGDRVAIHGIGGLGHLALQFARAMGFEVIAITGSPDKEAFARRLGAHHVVTGAGDTGAAEALQAMGGAHAILATAPNAPAISSLVPGLAAHGTLMVVGAPMEPIQAKAGDLISRDARIQGWASGTAADSADAMAFAARHGIKPMIETFPLQEAPRALEAMMKGKVRFRAVLTF